MKNSKAFEMRRRHQIAGSVFFTALMVVILFIGLSVNNAGDGYEADKPETIEQDGFGLNYIVYTTTEMPDFYTVTEPETTEPQEQEETQPVKVYIDVPLSNELQEFIENLADEYDIPSEVVVAIIKRESNFDRYAVGGEGEMGLMQIHPCNTWQLYEELGVSDLFDPEENIWGGIYLLSKVFHKYDTTAMALMCYNCGETRAKQLFAQGIYETSYTRDISRIIDGFTYREAA